MAVALSIGFDGAIPDYSTLIERVAEWMDRDDLTDKIPVYIGMFEAQINRVVRSLDMETSTTLEASGPTVELPDDCRKLKLVATTSTPNMALRQIALGAREFSGDAGTPVAYALQGRSLILSPPPEGSVTLAVTYFAKVPSLSEQTPFNWLLLEHPDIYLYGSLMQAAAQLPEPEALAIWKTAYDTAVTELIDETKRSRWSSGMRIPSGVVQTGGGRC